MITNLLPRQKKTWPQHVWTATYQPIPCMFFVSIASCPGWISQVFLPPKKPTVSNWVERRMEPQMQRKNMAKLYQLPGEIL